MSDTEPDVSELTRMVVNELDPGTVIDGKFILSRRQLIAIAGSGLSAGALATYGVTEAGAQEAPDAGSDMTLVENVSNVWQQNISFNNLSPSETSIYKLFISVTSERSTERGLFLTINENTSDDYETISSDGTTENSTNGIKLYDTTDTEAHASGLINITRAGNNNRVGFHGDVAPGQFGRIGKTFDTGGLDEPEWPISSIELNATQGDNTYNIANASLYKFNY